MIHQYSLDRLAKVPRFLYADREDSDQTGRMPNKIIHYQVAIYPKNRLYPVPVDTGTRHSNPNCYKQIQTSKDIYRFSYNHTVEPAFPNLLLLLIQLKASKALSLYQFSFLS